MTSWSIQPHGVLDVLTRLEGSATELGAVFNGLAGDQEALNGAMDGGASTTDLMCVVGPQSLLAPLSGAMGALLEQEIGRMDGVAHRVQSCASGAAEATTAYVHGDEQMAASTQSAAVTAAASYSAPTGTFGGGGM